MNKNSKQVTEKRKKYIGRPAKRTKPLKKKKIKKTVKKKVAKKLINKRVVTESGRNVEWEYNNLEIGKAFFEIVDQKKRRPTGRELATATGLTEETISRHLRESTLAEVALPYKSMADNVLLKMTQEALKGSYQDRKLYWQIIWKWTERFQVDVKNISKELTKELLELFHTFIIENCPHCGKTITDIEDFKRKAESIFDRFEKFN